MKVIKATVNTLSIGDRFTWLGCISIIYLVTDIKDETIFYTSNGRSYNCNYDNGRCNKIINK